MTWRLRAGMAAPARSSATQPDNKAASGKSEISFGPDLSGKSQMRAARVTCEQHEPHLYGPNVNRNWQFC